MAFFLAAQLVDDILGAELALKVTVSVVVVLVLLAITPTIYD